MSDSFCHLHVHSHYSLLDGANRLGDLVESAKRFGMTSLALTDHGNLFGAAEFYKTAIAGGVKPILGMEAYISPTTRHDKTMGKIRDASYHLLLLAMNEKGWFNLKTLSSRAYLEGFYYRPRIDLELLAEFGEGIICTTACIGGLVPHHLLAGRKDEAKKVASQYLDIFGPERFFIEVQNHSVSEQARVNPMLVELASDLGVGLVGTNDVHFLTAQSTQAHKVLTCIAMGKTLADDNKLTYPPELYFKNSAEMRDTLKDFDGAADNTLKIAEMCNVEIDFSSKYLPHFQTPNNEMPEDHLKTLAHEGLTRRFPDGVPDKKYDERLAWELKVIKDKGYSSYFLIVNDFVQYAKSKNIPSAPRGSGVATLLGFCLGIADVDPLKYGLLFERFTDPQREEDPDIDIDICQEGRGKIIQYVREKYGHVAQIITYGTLKARAVIRDVARVMDIPLSEVDTLTKLVPEGPKVTLEKAMKREPELRKLYQNDPRVKQLIDYGKQLEGLARHSGIHAAGVIVCDQPLENLIPLCRQSDSEYAVTQWDGPTCEKAGMMKMDFLGLRTLTIIQRARELVKTNTGEDIDPTKLNLDDPKVFKLFQKAQTDGVFQFESDGMKNVLLQMKPSQIEDLIAANAMYRPGPMELIPSYCSRKNGSQEVPSVHPLVDDLLAETFGIMAYQEQVMQVLNRLGKLPLNRALTLIKAISKKKLKVIAAEKPNFITGAGENGISADEANALFDLIEKFAGYGFNKAHSTQYAIVAFQTAYFKVYYPREFLAATLTFESGDTSKVVQYMGEARRMGIKMLPPDINTCNSDFTVDGSAVRFGLAAVKGVGQKAVRAIMETRTEIEEFTDLFHFCEHVELRAVNRSTIEALIKCGAFDALGASRAAMIAVLDKAILIGADAAKQRKSGQMSFFGDMTPDDKPALRFPDVDPWSESQVLLAEKETLGFYITSHPLVKHGRVITSLSQPRPINLLQLENFPDRTRITVGCMIAQVRTTFTKKSNRKMAMLTLEDLAGKADAVVFPDSYDDMGHLLTDEAVVFLTGTLDRQRERPSILIDEIIPIEQAVEKLSAGLKIRLQPVHLTPDNLSKLMEILKNHPGNCPVFITMTTSSKPNVQAQIKTDLSIAISPALLDALEEFLGDQDYYNLIPKAQKPPAKPKYKQKQNGNRGAYHAQKPASEAVTRFD